MSIHVQGLSYDVMSSDGASVGDNPDTTTNGSIRYIWRADREGVYLFSDMADTRSNEEGTNVHGLFGAIIVEEAGSFWLNPVTGEPLGSGLFADIYHPAKAAFREYAVFFHDELEILTKDGTAPVDPHTGLPSGTTAISYRSEPMCSIFIIISGGWILTIPNRPSLIPFPSVPRSALPWTFYMERAASTE